MLLSQAGVSLGLIGIAFGNPSHSLVWTVACAFFVAFSSATQDVVVDGWRIGAAPVERQGMMSASYQLGYRIALLCAGAGALYIADFAGWKAAYMRDGLLMAVGISASVLAPHPPQTEQGGPRESFLKLYAEPVADLLRRNGAMIVPILALVAIYRVPDFVSGVMANPLYIDLGFSKTAIATVTKIYGVWIGIAGVFAGGIAVLRLGLMPALLIGAIAASASHLTFAWLALAGAPARSPDAGHRHRKLRFGLCRHSAHRLHVFPDIAGLCGSAICAVEFALRAAGQACRRTFRAHGRHFRLPRLFRHHLGHRHPGGASLPLCLARHACRTR